MYTAAHSDHVKDLSIDAQGELALLFRSRRILFWGIWHLSSRRAGSHSLRMQVRVGRKRGWVMFLNELNVRRRESAADVKYTCNVV